MKYEQYVEPGRNVSKILDAVFAQYDKRIRPFYEGQSNNRVKYVEAESEN